MLVALQAVAEHLRPLFILALSDSLCPLKLLLGKAVAGKRLLCQQAHRFALVVKKRNQRLYHLFVCAPVAQGGFNRHFAKHLNHGDHLLTLCFAWRCVGLKLLSGLEHFFRRNAFVQEQPEHAHALCAFLIEVVRKPFAPLAFHAHHFGVALYNPAVLGVADFAEAHIQRLLQ
jgi:hypothetical protein